MVLSASLYPEFLVHFAFRLFPFACSSNAYLSHPGLRSHQMAMATEVYCTTLSFASNGLPSLHPKIGYLFKVPQEEPFLRFLTSIVRDLGCHTGSSWLTIGPAECLLRRYPDVGCRHASLLSCICSHSTPFPASGCPSVHFAPDSLTTVELAQATSL